MVGVRQDPLDTQSYPSIACQAGLLARFTHQDARVATAASRTAELRPYSTRMNPSVSSFDWPARFRAAAIHACLSLLVAAGAAALVFGVWYPYPYREISGGRELFTLVVTVDVVLGPLLTFAVFNRRKPRPELRRDLAVIVMLQLAGLAYGLHAVAMARPVHLAWELDRMRVIHAVDVPEELLARAPEGLKTLPWTGPTPVAVRLFRDAAEAGDVTLAALGGADMGARPDLWQSYAEAAGRIRASAQPVAALRALKPAAGASLDVAVQRAGVPESELMWLPLVSRKSFWTVLLRKDNLLPVAFLPLDPY